jgi:hypothetical protein
LGTHAPSGFSKAGKLECYPRPVSIWCPPAHKAITIFQADRDRSSIRMTAFTARFRCATRVFFLPHRESNSQVRIACFSCYPRNHCTTQPIQRISPKVEVDYRVYEALRGRRAPPATPHHSLCHSRKKSGLFYSPFSSFLFFGLLTLLLYIPWSVRCPMSVHAT